MSPQAKSWSDSAGKRQVAIALILLILMAITRGYHFATLREILPSASWAVFFLAGAYLQSPWALPVLLVFAGSLDYTAITWGGVSAYCISPAYVVLVPAYAVLWLAGRWYRARNDFRCMAPIRLAFAVFTGTLICEFLSRGSFYFLSERFGEPSLAGYGARLSMYFPESLAAVVFWVGLSDLARALATMPQGRRAASRKRAAARPA